MKFAAIPSWSMDGKWVYFVSNVDGRSQIWKAPSSGGDAVQVTRKGGLMAFESHDGKTLYYTKHDLGESGSLWKMPVGGGEEALVIPSVAGRNFAVLNTGVYFIEAMGEQAVIRFLLFATGEVKTVAAIPSWGLGISISPDERSLIYSRLDERPNGLMMVEDFRP
jgi:Tol biopolymer transport system component